MAARHPTQWLKVPVLTLSATQHLSPNTTIQLNYFYCKSLCILVVYVFFVVYVFSLAMYSYFVVYVFLLVVHVFLLWSMYSYCSSMYYYCCLCILIVVYVFLDAATLTEVFPCFFLGCKANARVILAKTGHGPHSSKIVVLFYVLLFCIVLCIVCV